jgi:flagellar export protein FliJ
MIRFTAVHTLYLQQEEAAKIELGRRERRRSEMLAARAVIAARLQAAAANVTPQLHEQYLAYFRAQQLVLAQHDAALATQDTAISDARTLLAQAHQQRTRIAKLRERDRLDERKCDERREQRRNDDRAALSLILTRSSSSPTRGAS